MIKKKKQACMNRNIDFFIDVNMGVYKWKLGFGTDLCIW
jgi:hypothetical protein